jgi:hypothetical protein
VLINFIKLVSTINKLIMTNKTLRSVASWVASATLVATILIPSLILVPSVSAESASPTTAGMIQNLGAVGSTAGYSTSSKSLPEMVGGIIQQVIMLLGIILVIIIIYAGFKWMTAGGNSDQVGDAKTMLINAVIGLALMLAAYAITAYVLGALIGATGQ